MSCSDCDPHGDALRRTQSVNRFLGDSTAGQGCLTAGPTETSTVGIYLYMLVPSTVSTNSGPLDGTDGHNGILCPHNIKASAEGRLGGEASKARTVQPNPMGSSSSTPRRAGRARRRHPLRIRSHRERDCHRRKNFAQQRDMKESNQNGPKPHYPPAEASQRIPSARVGQRVCHERHFLASVRIADDATEHGHKSLLWVHKIGASTQGPLEGELSKASPAPNEGQEMKTLAVPAVALPAWRPGLGAGSPSPDRTAGDLHGPSRQPSRRRIRK
jgi:hypothetical protein